MQILTKAVYQMVPSGLRLLYQEGFEYSGPVVQLKGATAAENSIAGSQQNFMNTLQQSFGTAFSSQQNILNGLTKSLNTTLAAGPSQYGFSQAETQALNTQATSGTAAQYQSAKAAAGEASAAAGGGNAVLPNNAAATTQAGIAQGAAQQESNQLLGIQEAGWQQGTANYNEAVSGLNQVASTENPNGLAGSANSAGSAAFGSASQIQQQNQAASPWGEVGGLVGSLGGAFLGGLGGGLGKSVFGGGGSSGGGGGGNSGISTSGAGILGFS